MAEFSPMFMPYTLERLPHRDVDDACRVMAQSFPEATPVPNLTRSIRMWIEGIPGLKVDREKQTMYFDFTGEEDRLTGFYDHYLARDWDYFAISPELQMPVFRLAEMYREQPWPGLKLIYFTVPGIYSVGLSAKDENGIPAIYNDTMRDILVKALAIKARWRERQVQQLFPGVKTMIGLGDGALTVFGSAGGAGRWDIIRDAFNEQMGLLEGITCIHCCGNFDWPLLMQTNTQVINFDAYQYGETISFYPDALKKFLGRGGMISWGIVPTTGSGGEISSEDPGRLAERLEKIIQVAVERGLDREQLVRASWVTPTCNPPAMSLEIAEMTLAYTGEVSRILRKKYFG